MFTEQQNVRIYLSDAPLDDITAETVQYCCIHLHNREPDELGGPVESVVWADLSTPSDQVEVDVGLTPGGVGNTAEVLAEAEGATAGLLTDAAAALEGVEFSRPTSLEEGLVLPTPTSEGEELAVWVRLTIQRRDRGVVTEHHCLIVFAGRALS